MNPGDRLIVALDVERAADADALAAKLEGVVRRVKVGLELYVAEGPSIVAALRARGFEVMLDLKLHDIPETVARSVARAVDLGVELLTVHVGGGRKMLEAAARAARGKATVLGVTVLTSLDDRDLAEVGVEGGVAETVTRRATLAMECGLGGVVSSPLEAARIRAAAAWGFKIVTPGIRPADGAGEAHDQKRVATPAAALAAGADLIVVGRPIRDAADPAAAARAIIAELARAGGG